MNADIRAIQARQNALLAECARERELFAAGWRGLERPVAVAYRGANALRSPWLWAGAGLVALKLPKRRLLRIPVLLWKGWKLALRIRALTGR